MPDFLPDVEGANGLKRETQPMVLVAPNGAMQGNLGPTNDFMVIANPAEDVTLPSIGTTFAVLVDGVVSVRTAAGNDRTFDGTAGFNVVTNITHVLAATTATLLIPMDV